MFFYLRSRTEKAKEIFKAIIIIGEKLKTNVSKNLSKRASLAIYNSINFPATKPKPIKA